MVSALLVLVLGGAVGVAFGAASVAAAGKRGVIA